MSKGGKSAIEKLFLPKILFRGSLYDSNNAKKYLIQEKKNSFRFYLFLTPF